MADSPTSPRPTPPAWFNLDALIAPAAVNELHALADEVEKLTAGFEGLAERCFRALVTAEEPAGGMYIGDEGFALLADWSGSGRLHDALYALTNTVEAANREKPEAEPVWLAKVRVEMGLDEWGLRASGEGGA